jgi:hypothetical protein
LKALAATRNIPFLTCNVRSLDGELLGDPFRVITAAGYKLALIGVSSDREPLEHLRIDPPREAILATLAEIDDPYDWLVVLAFLGEDELRELAENLPEADVILGGATRQSVPPYSLGPTLLAAASNKGKFLAVVSAPAAALRFGEGAIVEMTGEIPDDAQQVDNLHQFYELLAERDLTAADTPFRPLLPAVLPEQFRIAGSARCAECHLHDCQVWEASGHAHAWHSLRQTGAHVDSYCQQCHTTGFGLPGGFHSARTSVEQVAVGCESCHGPCEAHAAAPHVRTAYSGLARNQCGSCHDRENSPNFVLEEYWAQVRHGTDGDSAAPQSTGEAR